jgi:hypothetical protein
MNRVSSYSIDQPVYGHRFMLLPAMAKQVAPERHEICEVVATLLAHAGGMNERTDSRRLYQLNNRYWQAVVA